MSQTENIGGRNHLLGSRFEEPRMSPGFLLWKVATRWQRQVRSALDEIDLTHAQFVILASATWLGRELAGADGSNSTTNMIIVTQAEIADHACTDAVMTSEVLRTLERKGFLNRLPNPKDARARQIVVTDLGKANIRKAIEIVEKVDEVYFGSTHADIQGLGQLLLKSKK
jgi:DNA-binding MarR family transcriptional regulator